jgi:hypothetical protein
MLSGKTNCIWPEGGKKFVVLFAGLIQEYNLYLMQPNDYWEKLSLSEWHQFALDWLAEVRCEVNSNKAEDAVVAMNFTAHPKLQWQFILLAVSLAQSDNELGSIAAGPIEHLLGWYGEDFIGLVEEQAGKDEKFARTLTGVWKYKMTDEVWSRLNVLQSKAANHLS